MILGPIVDLDRHRGQTDIVAALGVASEEVYTPYLRVVHRLEDEIGDSREEESAPTAADDTERAVCSIAGAEALAIVNPGSNVVDFHSVDMYRPPGSSVVVPVRIGWAQCTRHLYLRHHRRPATKHSH